MELAVEESDEEERGQLLREGMKKINERNKILRVMGRCGWETAQAYLTDPIASDEEDENRLKKARKEAIAAKQKSRSYLVQSLRGRTCPALQSSHFSNQAAKVVSQPQHQCGKKTVGGAENPGTTTAFVVPPYHPSTPQGPVHQSSMETYSHNFFNISKGVDNDFICDYSSSSSVDNDDMKVENYEKEIRPI